MVDKNQDQDQFQDEYQFADLDVVEPESEGVDDAHLSTNEGFDTKQIVKKVLIVFGIIVMLIIVYKFMGSIFSHKSKEAPAVAASPITPIVQAKPISQPIIAAAPVMAPSIAEDEAKKISTVQVAQEGLIADVGNLNNQVSTITANIADLTTKIDQLTQTLNSLAVQVSNESNQLAALTTKVRTVRAPHVVHRRASVSQRLYYYIQAIIPGRAWLVATNGATLSVREGTSIPGYGVVKLIDANQGRIMTSSGRLIRFSQQDS